MKIRDIEIREIRIPFNFRFKHSSAERMCTESVLVIARSVNDNFGYGEGCPRSYVTGETIESCLGFFKKYKPSIARIETLGDIRSWLKNSKNEIDKNPSIWCAVELALLDLLAKEQTQSIEGLLALHEVDNEFFYSAVLGEGSYEQLNAQFEQYVRMRFKDFKIKLSGDLGIDKQKIELFRALDYKDVRVRVDANNLWKTPNEAITFIKALDYPFFAIEEPIKVDQYNDLRVISNELNTKIILDESFLRKEQFQHIESTPNSWIINIRVSKMGGILRSLDVAKIAQKKNIKIIIGAQVGETSILTRAAITVANTYRDILLAQEGAFGTYLLKDDICKPPLMFGRKGILNVKNIIDPCIRGFGLNVNLY